MLFLLVDIKSQIKKGNSTDHSSTDGTVKTGRVILQCLGHWNFVTLVCTSCGQREIKVSLNLVALFLCLFSDMLILR